MVNPRTYIIHHMHVHASVHVHVNQVSVPMFLGHESGNLELMPWSFLFDRQKIATDHRGGGGGGGGGGVLGV